MDPLIRKINTDNQIQRLSLEDGTALDKVCGYADNIMFIIKDNAESLKNIFKIYHALRKISGIELNTTKTEILRLGDEVDEQTFQISNMDGSEVDIKSIEALANKANITDKITNLETQFKRWLWRGLSLEGKIMIVKTFGISQLIYFLQFCEITKQDLIRVERTIFKFIWNKKWEGKCPDKIKRQV